MHNTSSIIPTTSLKRPGSRRRGFTLVEIMITVAIIALLAAIAVPGFLRARKRSQATTILENLRIIDAAKDQYATDYVKTDVAPTAGDLAPYFKPGSALFIAAAQAGGISEITPVYSGGSTSIPDPKFDGVTYLINDLGTLPVVLLPSPNPFSDAVDENFWAPYEAFSNEAPPREPKQPPTEI